MYNALIVMRVRQTLMVLSTSSTSCLERVHEDVMLSLEDKHVVDGTVLSVFPINWDPWIFVPDPDLIR
jgi:hypothetical protein